MENRSAYEIIVVCASEVKQLSVLSRTHLSKIQNNKVKRLEVRDSPCRRLELPSARRLTDVERWRPADSEVISPPRQRRQKIVGVKGEKEAC